MQFPESWLREFCNPALGTDAVAELLTMAGLEVEDRKPAAPPFSGVVVAEIVSAEPHPNADRLRVCQVDAGAHSPQGLLQIVCGAPNARVGIRVPLALVGATLQPTQAGSTEPFTIGASELRGVASQGMLCSARELKLSEDHGGLLELPGDAPVGQDIRQFLALDDTLFTLKLTPNLGHCLSVYGVARELSALSGAPLKPLVSPAVPPKLDERLPVRVDNADLCGRFSGRIVRGVNPRAKTPAWIVDRLARCGQRSVSALVDISNYVMFELGRPTHIFDFDKIEGGLTVRWAKPGETLELLNGNTVTLDESVGVIADEKGVESLAGIMGGQATAVSDDTRNIYIEAAFWWPEAVAGRSRRFNFSTDAGHRFERGVDAASTLEHLEHITALVLAICGGEAGPLTDLQPAMPAHSKVSMRVSRAAKVVGMPISADECAGVFERLGLPFTLAEDVFTITPPSWRFDLNIEEDLIEEVARVLGFERLPDTPPLAPASARVRTERRRGPFAVRHRLADLGFQETINFSFVESRWEAELAGNADPIRVLNPIAAPLSVMRSSLVGSLVQVLKHNLARKASRVRVFEIGCVFSRDPTALASATEVAGVAQPMRLAALAYGPSSRLQWGRPETMVDFFDLKGDLEALLGPTQVTFVQTTHPALHPGRCAAVQVAGQGIGTIGELHPRWRQAYDLPLAPVLFELDLAAVLARQLPLAAPLPRQQAVFRDLALVGPERVSHDALISALRNDGEGLVREATLFDIYRPATANAEMDVGERSLAVRLELRSDDATLTDARIEEAVAAALARAASRCGVRLRAQGRAAA